MTDLYESERDEFYAPFIDHQEAEITLTADPFVSHPTKISKGWWGEQPYRFVQCGDCAALSPQPGRDLHETVTLARARGWVTVRGLNIEDARPWRCRACHQKALEREAEHYMDDVCPNEDQTTESSTEQIAEHNVELVG